MAYIYAQIEFESIISDLDRFYLWISDDSRCYFAVSESVTQPEWSYYAGNASHALESGNLLTAYDTEGEAETNYFSTSKDGNGMVFAMLPNFEKAKLVRVFFDEDYPLVLYEFNPEDFWYVDDTPVDGRDTVPISSNWAYDMLHGTDLWRRKIINAGETLYINDYEQKLVHDSFEINGSGIVYIDDSGELYIIGAG